MEITQNGWVVINIGHPISRISFIVSETFSKTRNKAIKEFVGDSANNWRHWREKYNYRVVRAKQTISV